MTLLFYVGVAIAIVSGIWLLIIAFRTGILWGLGSLFVPFVGLIFVITHWQESKKPFLWNVLGVGMMIVAAMVQPELMGGRFGVSF